MAIKPSDADNLLGTELEDMNALEKRIDAELAKNYIPGENCKVDVPFLNARQVREVKRRYQEAGWSSVEYKSHQDARDGYAYLEFYSDKRRASGPDAATVEAYYKK